MKERAVSPINISGYDNRIYRIDFAQKAMKKREVASSISSLVRIWGIRQSRVPDVISYEF